MCGLICVHVIKPVKSDHNREATPYWNDWRTLLLRFGDTESCESIHPSFFSTFLSPKKCLLLKSFCERITSNRKVKIKRYIVWFESLIWLESPFIMITEASLYQLCTSRGRNVCPPCKYSAVNAFSIYLLLLCYFSWISYDHRLHGLILLICMVGILLIYVWEKGSNMDSCNLHCIIDTKIKHAIFQSTDGALGLVLLSNLELERKKMQTWHHPTSCCEVTVSLFVISQIHFRPQTWTWINLYVLFMLEILLDLFRI